MKLVGHRPEPRRAATEDRLDPGQQLPDREGLGHVVVSADVQPENLVDLLAPGRQDENRDAAAVFADLATDLVTAQRGSIRSRMTRSGFCS